MAIRIIIADDHLLVREVVAADLEGESDFELVGIAEDAGHALELVREKRPDVLLLDVEMPGMCCFEAARRVRSEVEGTRVVFLSGFVHGMHVEQAMGSGARGFVTKRETRAALVAALREVAGGGTYFSADITSLASAVSRQSTAVGGDLRSWSLTPRESEMLRYVGRGLTNKEIATLARISVRTVDAHLRHLMDKLGLHDRVSLARFAIREGFVEP